MSSFTLRTAAAQRTPAPAPASLTRDLQTIPAGTPPLQHYTQTRQAFEQVPLGQQTQHKDMEVHLQNIMGGWDGVRR
ncbi:hypothetical protein MMC15_001474 [Xylographa vitiligo]|nr:hypothetical protein [Xylographa vitiligo]